MQSLAAGGGAPAGCRLLCVAQAEPRCLLQVPRGASHTLPKERLPRCPPRLLTGTLAQTPIASSRSATMRPAALLALLTLAGAAATAAAAPPSCVPPADLLDSPTDTCCLDQPAAVDTGSASAFMSGVLAHFAYTTSVRAALLRGSFLSFHSPPLPSSITSLHSDSKSCLSAMELAITDLPAHRRPSAVP